MRIREAYLIAGRFARVRERERVMFKCLECGKVFKTTRAAERAADSGCPKCGGVDIDLAPAAPTVAVAARHRARIERENARMPAPLVAVMMN